MRALLPLSMLPLRNVLTGFVALEHPGYFPPVAAPCPLLPHARCCPMPAAACCGLESGVMQGCVADDPESKQAATEARHRVQETADSVMSAFVHEHGAMLEAVPVGLWTGLLPLEALSELLSGQATATATAPTNLRLCAVCCVP